jgi:hypothetical protein
MPTLIKPPVELVQVDWSQPLKNARYEAFAVAVVAGASQSEAYRATHPNAKRWKEVSVTVAASRLAANVLLRSRVAFLQKMSASDKISTVTERKETLTEIHRGRLNHFGTAGADGFVPNVGPENINSAALESVKSRCETTGKGDGKTDAVITEIKLRDPVAAIRELNKMEGVYEAKKVDLVFSGGVTLEVMLQEAADAPRGLPTEKMVEGTSRIISAKPEKPG